MAGVDLETLPLRRALNVVDTLRIDDAIPAVVVETRGGKVEVFDRRRVREELNKAIAGANTRTAPPAIRRPAEPDPTTWGLLPEHQRGLSAAMAFVAGGPL